MRVRRVRVGGRESGGRGQRRQGEAGATTTCLLVERGVGEADKGRGRSHYKHGRRRHVARCRAASTWCARPASPKQIPSRPSPHPAPSPPRPARGPASRARRGAPRARNQMREALECIVARRVPESCTRTVLAPARAHARGARRSRLVRPHAEAAPGRRLRGGVPAQIKRRRAMGGMSEAEWATDAPRWPPSCGEQPARCGSCGGTSSMCSGALFRLLGPSYGPPPVRRRPLCQVRTGRVPQFTAISNSSAGEASDVLQIPRTSSCRLLSSVIFC